MAFRESTGGHGVTARYFKLQDDPRRGVAVYFVIDTMSQAVVDEVNRKHGERVRDKRTRQMTWQIPEANNAAATKEMARLLWRDTVNAYVRLATDEAVAFYTTEHKVEPGHYKVGDEVLLDGKLTDGIKTDLLSDDAPLAAWIIGRASDAEAEGQVSAEEVVRKNSQSSSSSASSTPA